MSHPIYHVKPSKELIFEPMKWNSSWDVLNLANCFAYALNRQDLNWPFWQSVAQMIDGKPVKTTNIMAQWYEHSKKTIPASQFAGLSALSCARFVGMHELTAKQAHDRSENRHVIAYSPFFRHFYRKDSTGIWSHKDGHKPATNLDDCGSVIENLEQAFWRLAGGGFIGTPESRDRYFRHSEITRGNMQRLQYYAIPEEGVYIERQTLDELLEADEDVCETSSQTNHVLKL